MRPFFLRFLCRRAPLPAFIAALALSAGSTATAGDDAITLDQLPLLFADDSGVATREGLVRTVHVATTRERPVLEADEPWEGERVYIYGSAYYDAASREYRLWYGARPGNEVAGRSDQRSGNAPSLRNNGFDVTLYATSRDGVRWKKAELGIHAFEGSTANNIIFDLHSASVLRDDFEKDPAKRYKMLGYLIRPAHAYQAAYSADGIHWTPYPKSAVLEHGDTVTLSQNPQTGEYLAYHKRPAEVRGRGRRVVWLSRSTDFQNWSDPELVFVPDEEDDTWVSKPDERTEVYNMSVFPHAAGYIGLPAMFRVMKVTPRDQTGPGQSPLDGPIDIQLATSRDGRAWQRSWPRLNVIPRGAPGTFDGGALLGVTSVPVHTDKETWVYYTAINTGHGGPMPPKRITIGRAEWRLHGFASLDAGPAGGSIETMPLRFLAPNVFVNADASRGLVRAALVDGDGREIAGFGFEDAAPLRADDTRWIPRWRGGDVPQDRAVRLALRLENARLYSIGGAR